MSLSGYITYGLRYLNDVVRSSELLKGKDMTHITVAVIAFVVLIATLIDGKKGGPRGLCATELHSH